MTQPTVDSPDIDETEALFRRVMAGATDEAWRLRVDEEVLAALYRVLNKGARRKEASEGKTD